MARTKLALRGKKEILALVAIVLVSAGMVTVTISGHVSAIAKHPEDTVDQYRSNEVKSLNDLFGNFSQMTVRINSTAQDGSGSIFQASYTVLGTETVLEEYSFRVNITGTDIGNGASDTESLIAWVGTSSGQILQTYDSEDGYLQGTKAEQENSTLFMFTTMSWLSMINSSTVSQTAGSQERLTLGGADLNVVTFHGLSSFKMLQNWTVKVGTIVSNGVNLVMYSSFEFSGSESTFEIISMTPAPSPA
jgi:hypothetical protein